MLQNYKTTHSSRSKEAVAGFGVRAATLGVKTTKAPRLWALIFSALVDRFLVKKGCGRGAIRAETASLGVPSSARVSTCCFLTIVGGGANDLKVVGSSPGNIHPMENGKRDK